MCHATEGILNFVKKKCGHKGCLTKPLIGVLGSRKAEFYVKHATEDMVTS